MTISVCDVNLYISAKAWPTLYSGGIYSKDLEDQLAYKEIKKDIPLTCGEVVSMFQTFASKSQ